jgi:hypothetical protein
MASIFLEQWQRGNSNGIGNCNGAWGAGALWGANTIEFYSVCFNQQKS